MLRRRITIVPLVASLALLMASLISSAEAAEQGAAPVEGESFTKPPGTQVVLGDQYSGGKALKITNSKAVPTKRVTITETSNVLVRAHAGQRGGSPTLTIRMDGSNVGTRRITSSVLSDYLYAGITLQPGTYTIGLKGGNLAQGRYVFVDAVKFVPVEEEPPGDTTAPVLTQTEGPAEGELYSGGQIFFESNESVSFSYDMCTVGSSGPCPNYRLYDSGTPHTTFELRYATWSTTQDTPMVFYIKAVDAAGNVAVVERRWTQQDGAPPEVTVDGPEGPTNTRPSYWFSANEDVTWECTYVYTPVGETTPGAPVVEPCGDGGNKAFTLNSNEGIYVFSFKATDAAGNTTTVTKTIEYDITKPIITDFTGLSRFFIEGGGKNNLRSEFSVNEPAATIECSLTPVNTGNDFQPCTSPFTRENLADGQYLFVVRVIDPAGNISDQRFATEIIDSVDPVASIDSGPADGSTVSDSSVTFAWTANDNWWLQTVNCYLIDHNQQRLRVPDGGANLGGTSCGGRSYDEEWTYGNPATFSNLIDGEYTFVLYVQDAGGNAVRLERDFTVATDPPPVFTLPETLGPFENRSATVEWTTSEPVHSVKCELYLSQSNGEVVQINIDTACSSPKTYQGMNPGTYTFIVSGREI